MVKAKLVESRGWTPAQATRVDREYRRFLTLTLAHPETAIVPSVIVDEMWHAHILDTRAYAADCARTFGFFLHHFPYFGKRGPDDALALSSSFRHTLELYEAAFGPPSPDYWLHKDDGPTAAACSTDSECYGCSGSEGGCAGR